MAEILHQLSLVVFPIIYRVSYIPGGAGVQPSTVSPFMDLNKTRLTRMSWNQALSDVMKKRAPGWARVI